MLKEAILAKNNTTRLKSDKTRQTDTNLAVNPVWFRTFRSFFPSLTQLQCLALTEKHNTINVCHKKKNINALDHYTNPALSLIFN